MARIQRIFIVMQRYLPFVIFFVHTRPFKYITRLFIDPTNINTGISGKFFTNNEFAPVTARHIQESWKRTPHKYSIGLKYIISHIGVTLMYIINNVQDTPRLPPLVRSVASCKIELVSHNEASLGVIFHCHWSVIRKWSCLLRRQLPLQAGDRFGSRGITRSLEKRS